MNRYVPSGMMSFSAALARTAEALCSEAWALAKPEARAAFTESDASKRVPFGFWSLPGSLGTQSYAALRPMLAGGTLPAWIRGVEGAPKHIEAASWQSSGADRVDGVLNRTASFILADGTSARGDVLIRCADLETVLAGDSISTPTLPLAARPAIQTSPLPTRAGRKPNPDVDRFWIEVCRLVAHGGVKGGQAGYTDRMAQWSADNMRDPYDSETVRKKLGNLFKAIGWE